jgi:hypothetical protein
MLFACKMERAEFMVELIRKTGPNSYEFNYVSFKGETDEWQLIGTVCDKKLSGDAIDEYKSKSGKYMEVLRSKMYQEQLKGKITPITSEIPISYSPKKPIKKNKY